jgi:hypothetical protein
VTEPGPAPGKPAGVPDVSRRLTGLLFIVFQSIDPTARIQPGEYTGQ